MPSVINFPHMGYSSSHSNTQIPAILVMCKRMFDDSHLISLNSFRLAPKGTVWLSDFWCLHCLICPRHCVEVGSNNCESSQYVLNTCHRDLNVILHLCDIGYAILESVTCACEFSLVVEAPVRCLEIRRRWIGLSWWGMCVSLLSSRYDFG